MKGPVSDNYSRSAPVSTKFTLSHSHYYCARGSECMVSLTHGIIKYKYRYSYVGTDGIIIQYGVVPKSVIHGGNRSESFLKEKRDDLFSRVVRLTSKNSPIEELPLLSVNERSARYSCEMSSNPSPSFVHGPYLIAFFWT